MTRVAIVKGEDRITNVLQALELAGNEVKRKVGGQVLVKVNAVMQDAPLANTHPDALRAVLAYLDFNDLGYEPMPLIDLQGLPLPVRITPTFRQFDCLISLSVPKAHSDAVITLSGKNRMGFLENGQMWRIHGMREFGRDDNIQICSKVIHQNLRTLLAKVRPDVAVLDGFHSFEGGPVLQCGRGDYVEPRLALAGADFVAVDSAATTVFGFNPLDVGYLVYASADGYGARTGALPAQTGSQGGSIENVAVKIGICSGSSWIGYKQEE
ncbi:MAG: DUF362 domain-containing protein [Chloroflexi bacterium]|nr:DUF362 domain-containing protein [Chloroflexota bacterium]